MSTASTRSEPTGPGGGTATGAGSGSTVTIGGGVGPAARAARARALDGWLTTLLPVRAGVALVAVGGLGRREQAPRSDLDLVLIHTGRPDIAEVAAAVWYPVWDAGYSLDHSVRTLDEALAVAGTDARAAVGLLDARLVAGDAWLACLLRRAVAAQWRRDAYRLLPPLFGGARPRWAARGELAGGCGGDLKESRGGLRDVTLARAAWRAMGDLPGAQRALRRLPGAHRWLLDVRDALHLTTGRRWDRLGAGELAEVGRLLEVNGPDEVARRVAEAARIIASAVDSTAHAVDSLVRAPYRHAVSDAAALAAGRIPFTRGP